MLYGNICPPLVGIRLTGLPKSAGGGGGGGVSYAIPSPHPASAILSLVYNQSSKYLIFKRYELSSRAAKDLNCPFLPSALDQNLDKYSQKKVLSLILQLQKLKRF